MRLWLQVSACSVLRVFKWPQRNLCFAAVRNHTVPVRERGRIRVNIQIFHNIFVNLLSLWVGFGVVVPSKYCFLESVCWYNHISCFWCYVTLWPSAQVCVGWWQHCMRFGHIETVCNVLLAVKIFFKSETCENTTDIVRRVPLCLTTL